MKHRLFPILLLVLLLVNLLPVSASAAEEVTINVYNWGQYIADGSDGYIDVIALFEEAYPHIKVNYMTFDSNESMYTKLAAGGDSFDIIIPSDYMVEMLIAEDRLEPLNFDNIPNFAYIDEEFQNPPYDPENLYTVPYTWGSVGIIYNSAYVDEADVDEGNWDLLWNEKYANKILMFDNPRDAFGIALLQLGYDINTEDYGQLDEAADLLRTQKPLVQSYVMDQVFDRMQSGEALIAPYYAGDFLLMVEENEDLRFYRPENGYNFFVDAICIPKGCQHKEEAEIFINFLLEPEICGGNLEYIGYSTPSSASKDFMDPEVATDPIANPDLSTVSKDNMFRTLPQEALQYMNTLWLTVKTDGSATTAYLIMTLVSVVLIIALWIFFKVRRKAAKARRCQKWKA